MKVDAALDQLRDELREAAAREGGRLPTERDLSRRLGVSRGTLRKALDRLEEEGAIRRRVGQGTFLASWGPPDAEGKVVLDATNPSEVMEARLTLEPALAATAVLKATPAQIAELEREVERMREAASSETFESSDSRFHRLIAQTIGNGLLLGVFDAVNAAREAPLWGRLKAASLTPERMTRYCDQHEAIVSALRQRDLAGAESAMRVHLQAVRDNILNP